MVLDNQLASISCCRTSFLYLFSITVLKMKNLIWVQGPKLHAALIILMVAISVTSVFGQSEISPVLLVPMAQSGENIYLVWSSNNTGNSEIMFRASNDNGTTFAEKINLSNNTTSDSINAQIMASGNNVFVTWWEQNQTADTPVMRMSTNRGNTFGPILKLAANNTLMTGEEKDRINITY